jgi:ureidoglycolate dehydrogenase (NAD+)
VFRCEVDRLIKSLKALPRDPEVAEILLPGERGNKIRAQRARDGIPLPPPILAELNALADRLGVEMVAAK